MPKLGTIYKSNKAVPLNVNSPYISSMKYLLLVFVLVLFEPVMAQRTSASQKKESLVVQPPKLVVGIVVDQMRYDYLSKFSSKFSNQGFKRLQAEGYSFDENYINYVPSNTGPGHATIHTGTTPSQHGILNNSWYNKRSKSVYYCTYDKSVEAVGTGSKVDRNSPHRLLMPTLSDIHKEVVSAQGKTISVALKDRAAVLSGGKKADAAYWFRGRGQGSWISSSYYMERLPHWVKNFNESNLIDRYMQTWEPLYPIESYSESGPDLSSVEWGFKGRRKAIFPYDLKKLAKKNGEFDLLRVTPFGNSYTVDFALAAVDKENLGTDSITDFLLISFSSTDYIGHNFGVDSKEVQDAFLRLDRDIGRLLNSLDILVGSENYVMFLTSDHGAKRNPNYETQDHSKDMQFFKEASFKIDVKEFAFDRYRNAKIIQRMAGNMVYLNDELIQNMNLNKAKVTASIKKYIKEYKRIGSVRTHAELASMTFETGVDLYLQNGFHPKYSGDITYTLDPGVVIYAKKGSSHGSHFSPDSHVPLIFYGAGIKQGNTITKTNPTDIAPTLSVLLGLPTQPQWKGRILDEVFEK